MPLNLNVGEEIHVQDTLTVWISIKSVLEVGNFTEVVQFDGVQLAVIDSRVKRNSSLRASYSTSRLRLLHDYRFFLNFEVTGVLHENIWCNKLQSITITRSRLILRCSSQNWTSFFILVQHAVTMNLHAIRAYLKVSIISISCSELPLAAIYRDYIIGV